ncbi:MULTISPECIES: hypothetical protein [unclassified Streptomyces]|uniref:hypothetical protein n=1 Tax=unclassified Streptomyces TaxID=2593676 RepID=UPI002258081D|nr:MULTISPECIES: hypothetical protein [unclassified Streptomyces]MCX4992619.1 hypothetical protein [Streptomyces sp. NBC_00568]MCX5002143.1 hypothetical protein [Streptomyces sp. NBC_00638]
MIVGIGVIVAVAVAATGGGTNDKKTPTESTGRSPSPSLSLPSALPSLPSGLPSVVPSLPSDLPTELVPTELVPTDLESLLPSLADDEVPYYMLQKGDCFDTDDGLPGQAVKRTCTEPHDAEVVKVAELDGTYKTNAALKKAASTLCQGPLERKAAGQAAGTVRDTLVQYPDSGGYKVGIDKVACSLAADVGKGTHKLTKPLK